MMAEARLKALEKKKLQNQAEADKPPV